MFGNLRQSIHNFFYSQMVVPFETCFAFFCVYSGIAALLNFGIIADTFQSVIGEHLAAFFNIGFVFSGLALYFGVGLRRRDLEMCGLITIATSLVVRSIAIVWLLGFNPLIINTYISNFAFILACVIRGMTLYKYRISIEAVSRKL
jgi:hypothetical protein